MSYQVYYFNSRGRAEQIRLLLSLVEQPWENFVVSGENFGALKAEGPQKLTFGSVPMLQDGQFHLAQGAAIMNYLGRKHGLTPDDAQLAARTESIVAGAEDLRMQYFRLFGEGAQEKQAEFVAGKWKQRWLPTVEGLVEKAGGSWLVHDKPTAADVAMWDALDAILVYIKGADFDGFAQAAAFYDRVKALPQIANYLSSDRRIPE